MNRIAVHKVHRVEYKVIDPMCSPEEILSAVENYGYDFYVSDDGKSMEISRKMLVSLLNNKLYCNRVDNRVLRCIEEILKVSDKRIPNVYIDFWN